MTRSMIYDFNTSLRYRLDKAPNKYICISCGTCNKSEVLTGGENLNWSFFGWKSKLESFSELCSICCWCWFSKSSRLSAAEAAEDAAPISPGELNCVSIKTSGMSLKEKSLNDKLIKKSQLNVNIYHKT